MHVTERKYLFLLLMKHTESSYINRRQIFNPSLISGAAGSFRQLAERRQFWQGSVCVLYRRNPKLLTETAYNNSYAVCAFGDNVV